MNRDGYPRIPDLGSLRIFFHPGSRIRTQGSKSPGSRIRIRKTAKKPRNGTLGNSNQRILISSNKIQMPFLLTQTQKHKNFIINLPIFPSIETMKGLFSVALIFLHRKLYCFT
jgi:hypothetical protein